MTGPARDDERIARASLLRASEPAMASLVRHVRAVGPVQAVEDIRRGRRIGSTEGEAMLARLSVGGGEADLEAAGRLGIRLVCPGDDEWPTALDDLAAADADCFGVWVRGPLRLQDACRQAVAVVGTRAATEYGEHVAAELGFGLAERGWTVVSGLAFGVDAAAHRGALAATGPTVAVLASGADIAYPKGNLGLYEWIVASGAVVSEHPPGAAPPGR